MSLRIVAAFTGAVVVSVLAYGEIAHWQASRRRLGQVHGPTDTEAIVVLGYKNTRKRANYINRYRVRAGIRSRDSSARESLLVLCGGAVAGLDAEADIMARYARHERGFTGTILFDRTSATTWENMVNAIPLVERADSIKIVSNSIHAEKARAYLWKLRPDLAARLSRGEDYRLGELCFVKPVAAFLGLRSLRSLRD